MAVKIQKLRGLIVERETTQEAVADSIGINRSTFYRKMKGNGEAFTVREINLLAKELSLSEWDVIQIFFNPNVA